ncbi:hypothetical protein FVE85_8051 [Porphyridium purpureum]|uniref:Uncharacterized protein n=1 Tax=Porphyridium purpureum TaxID=35688 RepID=A0A5J4YPD1_PORPP|nr:hypothetical protein FVE85_8051 [Porphyridium purpureum]|eukprot:POR8416..scf295_9
MDRETQTNSANVKMSICGRVDLVQQFYVASHLKDDGGERCLHTMNEVVPNLIDLMQDMTAPRSYVLFDSYPFIMTMSSPKPHDEGSIHGKQNVIWIPPVYDIPAGCSNACLLDNSRRDGLPCALMIKQADLVAFVVAGIRRKAVMASLRGRVEPSLVALMRARKQT